MSNMIKIRNAEVNLDMLIYSHLFKVRDSIIFTEYSEGWDLVYPVEIGEIVCDAVEEHVGIAFDYSDALVGQVMSNKASELTDALQNHLDARAKMFRFDDIFSARSWAGFTNPRQEKALALSDWSSDCWDIGESVELEVIQGDRAMPTVQELLDLLPEGPIV